MLIEPSLCHVRKENKAHLTTASPHIYNSYSYVRHTSFDDMADSWSNAARNNIKACNKYENIYDKEGNVTRVFDPSGIEAPTIVQMCTGLP